MGIAILLVTGMVLETFLGWGAKIVEFTKSKLK
jgi:hypothetical protein